MPDSAFSIDKLAFFEGVLYELAIIKMNYINGESQERTIATGLACGFDALEQGNFKLVIDIAKQILSTNRNIPQAHYLIGRVTLETRQLDIALRAFETAAELDASMSEYWAFLALVYAQTGNMIDAETAVMRAQKIGSEKAQVLAPIAHVLSLLGYFDDATKYLRMAVQKSPTEATYCHALGVSLLELGDFKGAQEAIEKAIVLNPYNAESRWILSSLFKATDNVMAEQLVSIMDESKGLPSSIAYLGYGAGKLFEDTECWDKAFDAFLRGAAAKRSIVNYDRFQAKQTFEAIKTICTENWLRTAHNDHNEVAPIFIIGQPRTGTTLVDRIISSHSLVHSAGEPVQLAMSLRALTGVRTEEFISAELINKSKDVSGELLAESYLTGLANRRGSTPYFIDKFPMNFMLVGFIVKAFPKAKIVHVTRSPADTCFAVFKQLFEEVYQHSYDQCEMAEHYVMYKNLMEYWHAIMPDKIFDIAYEDIVTDNYTQARNLIKYLGLEWEDNCSNFEKNNTAVVTASAVQVRETAHNRSIGRWKNYEKQLSPTLTILSAAGISP
ncbi:tetratricopeptide repeat-containing sulfotransferase family protein [Paraglaciecola sp.]|uniref:tetratricopeptide repeat-containing sulfotransferase family protein n=1 Tax=Paraglaciecola sp. TaxID=1920173 RepID=UPI00273F866F|nr:tetratricopeptide repeat-containing sulfotransferase family protein [Paraglaciecola sp.]MDP5033274.1 sulfotransferase [Paraglaciecola sp.]